MRRAITTGVAIAVVVAALGVAQGGAGVQSAPGDVACRYFKTINGKVGAVDAGRVAEVAAQGSDAYEYGVFDVDLRDAFAAAGQKTKRTVECGARAVTVRLVQYSLPIFDKRVTTTYTAFESDQADKLVSFKVNGKRPAGRLVIGSGAEATVLGTTVALASAYQIAGHGGESIEGNNSLVVVVRATAPPDGLRDLATSLAEYRVAGGPTVPVHRVVAPGSPLGPGSTGLYVLQFSKQPIGGTFTVPVLNAPASQVGDDTAIETAVVPVERARVPARLP